MMDENDPTEGTPEHEAKESAQYECAEHMQDDEILEWANKAITQSSERFDAQYFQSREDLQFAAKEHWPQAVVQARGSSKPAPVYDLTTPYINRICNEIRENAPGISVRRSDSSIDSYLSEYLQGHIRVIEQGCNAKRHYELANKHQVTCGVGWLIAGYDYADEFSWDFGLNVECPDDPTSCLIDADSEAIDGSDAYHAMQLKELTKEAARSRYGITDDMAESNFPDPKMRSTWFKEKTVVIAKVWRRIEINDTLVLLTDAMGNTSTQWKSDIDSNPGVFASLIPLKTRPGKKQIVLHYILGGGKVIHKQIWPGTLLPVIPVYGDLKWHSRGKMYEGIVRAIMDAQRDYNYYKAAETELVSLAPRVPFKIPFGGNKGFEEDWNTINSNPKPYVYYNIKDDEGNPLPAPEREALSIDPTALSAARESIKNTMGAIVGISDSSIGSDVNESGKAILAKLKAADRTNSHFHGNFGHSLARLGKVWVDMKLNLVNGEEDLSYITDDGANKKVKIGIAEVRDPSDPNKILVYDVKKAKYDVVISMGPSYASKRDEASQASMEMLNALPDVQKASFAPFVVGMQSWPDAELAKNILVGTLSPEVQKLYKSEEDGEKNIPQEVQQTLDAMAQEIEASKTEADEHIKTIQQLQQQIAELNQIVLSNERQVQGRITEALIKEQGANERKDKELRAKNEQVLIENETKLALLREGQDHEAALKAVDHASKAIEESARVVSNPQTASAEAPQGGVVIPVKAGIAP